MNARHARAFSEPTSAGRRSGSSSAPCSCRWPCRSRPWQPRSPMCWSGARSPRRRKVPTVLFGSGDLTSTGGDGAKGTRRRSRPHAL